MTSPGWISAQWPAPAHIKAGTTTRQGGVSTGPYTSFNIAQHVDDDAAAVIQNRTYLQDLLGLSAEPFWLSQVHGSEVSTDERQIAEADAIVTMNKNQVCAVMTADCLPVLLCDRAGSCVAAAHAGWRGLAAGIIPQTIEKMPVSREQLLVWLGPAIGPDAFEVGEEVKAAFLEQGAVYQTAFTPASKNTWRMNIYQAARVQLGMLGIEAVYGGNFCTYSDAERFYSYRRDKVTGRMASMIWMEAPG